MAEKRKPIFTFLLRNTSKTNKVELFSGKDWGKSDRLFRMRVNGKWFPYGGKKEFRLFYKGEIRNIIFRSIKF